MTKGISGGYMPYQTFRIYRAPEEPPLKAEELKRLMWKAWRESEWEVREMDNKKSDKAEEQ